MRLIRSGFVALVVLALGSHYGTTELLAHHQEPDPTSSICMPGHISTIANSYDRAVSNGDESRSYFFGPYIHETPRREYYSELRDHGTDLTLRDVLYYEKGRVECVSSTRTTQGLLATELMTGKVQVGSNNFDDFEAAQIPVAGDPDNPTIPTYAAFGTVMDAPSLEQGELITGTLDSDGTVGSSNVYADYDVTAGPYFDPTGHRVASVFWDFMNAEYYPYRSGTGSRSQVGDPANFAWLPNHGILMMGYPRTEAYWTTALVAGQPRDVLTQCFERRCLTYTPENPDGWQVELGNVGLHYVEWHYGSN
jgi:thermitase